MRFKPILRHVGVLLCVLAQPLAAQGPGVAMKAIADSSAVGRLFQLQAKLVREAESTYRARVVPLLPGFAEALKEVEGRVRRSWSGLPPVILMVPDFGRGFQCENKAHTCLGRYLGAELTVIGIDSSATAMSSVIVIAESARRRPDVWMHELTHALLIQHRMLAESQRHDRRYFSEESFVMVAF